MMRNHIFSVLCLVTLAVLCRSASAQIAEPLPELASKRLLNDLQIMVAPTPYRGSRLTIGLVLRYGAAFDPAGKGGLAHLVSRLFMRATLDRTFKDIQNELAYLDATLEVRCDWDGFRFLLKGQSSNYERSLLLLYQVVGEAQFDEADFESVKQSILQDFQKPPDPRRRIHGQLEDVLFSGTTYGRPLEGTPESVSAITLGDVRLFYRKYFSPNQASLVVVGDVSAVPLLQRASRIWGVWVRNDSIPFTFAPPRMPAGRQIFLADDPNSPAAQFIIGCLFPRREDPVYSNTLVATRILQDRLTKLLPTSLVTASGEGRRLASPFYIQGQAAAEQAVDEIRKIQNAVAEIKNAPVSKEELASAQKALVEEFEQGLKSTEGLCNAMLDSELYRLGSNYAAAFPDQIRRCDIDAVRKVASDWIFPSGEVLMIRGPASTLKAALEPLGTLQQINP